MSFLRDWLDRRVGSRDNGINVLGARELRGDEERQRDTQHHEIRGDVEHSIYNQMVDSSRTLHFTRSAQYLLLISFG
jgi:hypothetical protein